MAGLLFFSAALPVKAYIQKPGTVNESVALRQNADESSNQVMQLAIGQEVKVNNEITDNSGVKWYQVFVNGNTMGYVPASAILVDGSTATNTNTEQSTQGETQTTTQQTTQTTTQTQTVTVTERVGTVTAQSAIRVREQATTASEQLASMEVNDTFIVLDEENAADGHVWYKVEFDDHGNTVYGYVRSDLVSVQEVTKEEKVEVEVPVTDTPATNVENPYSIISQKDAEGTTKWYILDANNGDAVEISSLLANSGNTKNDGGIYKWLMIAFLLLLIGAGATATFFYMKWQDAEDFIDELHEKQQKMKKQQAPAQPQRTAPAAKSAATPVSAGIPGVRPMPKPVAPMPRPVSRPVVQPAEQPVQRPTYQAPVQDTVVLPDTQDIVAATQRELQNNPTVTKTNPSNAWKSKNFLADDDEDLDFDFLDMDDK